MSTLLQIIDEMEVARTALDGRDDLTEVEREHYEKAITAYLEDLGSQVVVKAEGYIEVLKHIEADEEYLKARAKHYQAKAKTQQNRREWLRSLLYEAMVRQNIQTMKCPSGSISRRATPGQVVINCPDDQVPSEFVTYTPSINKAAIKAALESGQKLPWAEIVRGESLTIRG